MKALVLAVVVVFAQAACERDKHVSATATNAPVIKLTAAGSGPKQALRFTAKAGMKKVLVLAMDMGMTITVGGMPRTQQVPTIKMSMDIVVASVAANGDIRYDFKLRESEVVTDDPNDPVAASVKQALSGMTGLGGSAVVTNRGFTQKVDVNVPAGANAQVVQFVDSLKQSIGQMSAPLPEEPVGVGAKWETTIKLQQNGLELQQVGTNELVALDGNTITLDLGVKQTAAPQTIEKDGTKVELKSYTGSGGGHTTIDLTQLVPSKAEVSMKADMQMGAGDQDLGMSLDLKIGITSR
jgi:hypothetical protein